MINIYVNLRVLQKIKPNCFVPCNDAQTKRKGKIFSLANLKKNIFLVILFVSSFTEILAQNYTKSDIFTYIETYSDVAVRKMKEHGIPASITLAQGILESAAGTSDLAVKANNHFGIKCHKSWEGKTFRKDDDSKNECFRKYKSSIESFEDHSQFLKAARYADLYKLRVTDYEGWAHGLKKAGYATNPQYANRLIRIIEEYNLALYDRAAGSVMRQIGRASCRERV